jgi:hypothetical protein
VDKKPAYVIVRTDPYVSIEAGFNRYALVKVFLDENTANQECIRLSALPDNREPKSTYEVVVSRLYA